MKHIDYETLFGRVTDTKAAQEALMIDKEKPAVGNSIGGHKPFPNEQGLSQQEVIEERMRRMEAMFSLWRERKENGGVMCLTKTPV